MSGEPRNVLLCRQLAAGRVNPRLAPLEVDRSGKRAQYFLGYAWSMIDKRGLDDNSPELARVDLIAGDRRGRLESCSGPLLKSGLRAVPVSPPDRSATLLVARRAPSSRSSWPVRPSCAP